MSQILFRRDLVSNELFELFDFGKTALLFARPDKLIAHANFKHTSAARHQGYFSKFVLKCSQQLLRHPRRPQ